MSSINTEESPSGHPSCSGCFGPSKRWTSYELLSNDSTPEGFHPGYRTWFYIMWALIFESFIQRITSVSIKCSKSIRISSNTSLQQQHTYIAILQVTNFEKTPLRFWRNFGEFFLNCCRIFSIGERPKSGDNIEISWSSVSVWRQTCRYIFKL